MRASINMKLILSTWFPLIILMGCSYEGDSSIKHPTKENLPSNGNVLNAEEIKLNADDPESVMLLSVLENMREVSPIGEFYGAEEEMFGRIDDIVFDAFDRVYLLDNGKQLIRVFGYDGEYITTLGRQGQGPGEFENARSMVIYNDELLLVNNGYRIEVFEINSDEVTYSETLQFEKPFQSLCTAGDKLLVHGMPIPCLPLSRSFHSVNRIKAITRR